MSEWRSIDHVQGSIDCLNKKNTLTLNMMIDVISLKITNALVKRILIDIGSSIVILYYDAFQKVGLIVKDL